MGKKIGFIGCGVMGKSIMGGIIGSGIAAPGDITASDVFIPGLEAAKAELGIHVTTDNKEVVKNSDVIFLVVKPYILKEAIASVKDCITPDKLFISIAAGQTLEILKGYFGEGVKTIRVMPNTPAQVTAGMTGVCHNELVTEEDMEYAMELLNAFGKAEQVPEHLLDAVTGISGSGPAYVFLFIEALADGGVLEGLPRDQAYTFAAQTVYGSAKMVLDTGKHPGVLKDAVCSPAGTTIAAVAALERNNFRNAVIEAVHACAERSREMGK
ncbi:pyrroline-5-carboxylate reductase [Oscillibacter sp. PC13]|uniref:pyrroline-5-carboxylate reductase n=1 Tax=Oscillibacter sp. PC13 TaxID=1855299 RepID=UPI0008E99723|nr:pyrroline-5-carboxylate reductase [Oscillibacter sp. PC13]SFP84614.1 pyrroline-5-carboxylate reductase [Oscillibacter sp. PC13]